MKKKYRINFWDNIWEIESHFNETFPSVYKTVPSRYSCNFTNGDIVTDIQDIIIKAYKKNRYSAETIGHVNNFSLSELKTLSGGSQYINLELVLECNDIEKPDTNKIMEKSKSRNWKTVKILKRLKALKRYRIVKRLK